MSPNLHLCTNYDILFLYIFLDSKEELEDFDSDWAQTHRAKAISEEGDRRQNSRGRAKTGGYLDIWNDPDSDNQEEAHEDLPDPNDQVSRIDLSTLVNFRINMKPNVILNKCINK